MKKIIHIIIGLLLIQNHCIAQLYINNVDFVVRDTLLYVGDSVVYTGDSGRILVSGMGSNFLVRDDFNNRSAHKNIFDINTNGFVSMVGGATQYINGHATTFPYLILSGAQKIKALNTDIEVIHFLDLGNSIIDVNNYTVKILNAETNAILYDKGYIRTTAGRPWGKEGWLIRNVNIGERYVYPLGDEGFDRTFRPLVLTADRSGYIWGQFQNYSPNNNDFTSTLRSPTLKSNSTTVGDKYFYGLRLNGDMGETTINLGLPFESHDGEYVKMVQWDSVNYYWDSLPSILNTVTSYAPNNREVYAADFTLAGFGSEKIIGLGLGYTPAGPDIGNVVTPNGDGVNDFFKIKGVESLTGMHLTIFNRWQSVVYDKYPYENTASDGWTAQGLNPGTYFYILTAVDINTNKRVERRGYIEVIK